MSAEQIERFYAAFDRRDGTAMAAMYAPDGHFRDPVFGDLTGAEAGAMWRMLTRIADGLIVDHVDEFSFWKWSRQALGPKGLVLGWTPFLRRKVGGTAKAGLDKFIAKERARA